jgi:hypothetical protein
MQPPNQFLDNDGFASNHSGVETTHRTSSPLMLRSKEAIGAITQTVEI